MQIDNKLKGPTHVIVKVLGAVAGLILEKPRLVEQVGPGKQPKEVERLKEKFQSYHDFLH